ncbi:MAG: hypothetical protein ACKVX9_14275, partial [Blastocatellia bacterium]
VLKFFCLNPRSGWQHIAWGEGEAGTPGSVKTVFKPVKRATADALPPVSRAGERFRCGPGAYAPGYMLSPASQAVKIEFQKKL